MVMIDAVSAERFAGIMEEVLLTEVKKRLKEPLMKIAESEVDRAVDEAVAELNVRTNSHRDMQWRKDVIEFILTRKDV